MKKIDVNNSWEMHRVGDDDWIIATSAGIGVWGSAAGGQDGRSVLEGQ